MPTNGDSRKMMLRHNFYRNLVLFFTLSFLLIISCSGKSKKYPGMHFKKGLTEEQKMAAFEQKRINEATAKQLDADVKDNGVLAILKNKKIKEVNFHCGYIGKYDLNKYSNMPRTHSIYITTDDIEHMENELRDKIYAVTSGFTDKTVKYIKDIENILNRFDLWTKSEDGFTLRIEYNIYKDGSEGYFKKGYYLEKFGRKYPANDIFNKPAIKTALLSLDKEAVETAKSLPIATGEMQDTQSGGGRAGKKKKSPE
jgi:hypothetical protein